MRFVETPLPGVWVIELEELTHRFLGELVASSERISSALGYLRAGE